MLQAERLTVWRGFHCLFQDLSWRVAPGSVLLVQGPNGSGKTTLLRIIVGLTSPEEGRLLWNGRPLSESADEDGLLFAWQGHLAGLKKELTVAQNLAFSARMHGLPAAQIAGIAARLGLEERLDLEVRLLSAGQQRRLALARLLMSPAMVWVLDEPYTNLDQAGRILLEDIIAGHLARQGIAVIAAHHALGDRLRPIVHLQLGDAG